jgi:hypothetical protein
MESGNDTPLSEFAQEGDIPISLWFEDSLDDLTTVFPAPSHSAYPYPYTSGFQFEDFDEEDEFDEPEYEGDCESSSSSNSDEDELNTPTGEESQDLRELRSALFKAFEADPLGFLVDESLAALDDGLRASPLDCFADVCWASHQRRMSGYLPQEPVSLTAAYNDFKDLRPTQTIYEADVPEEAELPSEDLDLDFGYKHSGFQPSSFVLSSEGFFSNRDDISFSPSRPTILSKETDSGFKRFARRLRLESFGRR